MSIKRARGAVMTLIVASITGCLLAGAAGARTVTYKTSRLTKSSELRVARYVLWKEFGAQFSTRKSFSANCSGSSSTRASCQVAWNTKTRRYAGVVTMRSAVIAGGRHVAQGSAAVEFERVVPPKPTSQPTPQSNCDPNYTGACLNPDASDYDCEGGSGDGPYYTGTVTVVGTDHFGLDRDGDGIGCE